MKRKDDGIDVEGRAPGFFLYPSDLERELRPLPVGAQALWTRMFLQMHWAHRRGYLEHVTGEPFTAEDIARMVGMPLSAVNRHLIEMETKYGTFSRDEHGVIFNRRMVRDTEISAKRKAAGSMGGNPVLVGGLDKQNPDLDKQNENLVNQMSNQNGFRGRTRARGSFSSSSSAKAAAAQTTKLSGSPPPKNGSKEGHAEIEREIQFHEYARQALVTYPGAQRLFGSPDDTVIGKCLDLCRGYPVTEEEALKRALVKMAEHRKQPGTSWMWFPTVMKQYLERRA